MNKYEITHLCPPAGSGFMPCCGLPPFERLGDRMTLDPEEVTCGCDFELADKELAEGLTVELDTLVGEMVEEETPDA